PDFRQRGARFLQGKVLDMEERHGFSSQIAFRRASFQLERQSRFGKFGFLDGRARETLPLSHGEGEPGGGGEVGRRLRVPRGRGAGTATSSRQVLLPQW